jgi:hypothetical protein
MCGEGNILTQHPGCGAAPASHRFVAQATLAVSASLVRCFEDAPWSCGVRTLQTARAILAVVFDSIAQAFAGTPVIAAYLFGSRPEGRARADSDTDIAVLLPRGMAADLRLIGDLTVRLANAGVQYPDVHILGETPLAFQFEALNGERIFSADKETVADYEVWVVTRYLDFEPLLTLQYRIARRRLAEEGTLGRPRRRRSQADAA